VFWVLVPAVGAVLGVVAAFSTDFTVVLPSLAVFVALLAVGTLDATAGLFAALTYGAAVLLGGGMDSADAVRGFLGLAAPMFMVGLVASALRPYRRESVGDHLWSRTVDSVLIPLMGAWAAGTMFSAVPYLSGLDVAWSGRTGTVELAALLVLAARYGLENAARLWVSNRLRDIENEDLPEPGETQKTFSRIVRAVVFAFVAAAFIGTNWWLAAGTAMFLVPKLVEPLAPAFPNSVFLHRLLPRNLVRVVFMLLVMTWWGLWVTGVVESNEIRWAFVLMGIPGVALGAADWFGREGGVWRSTTVSRVLGIAALVLGVALVRGWLA
jgi:hypothetical protein